MPSLFLGTRSAVFQCSSRRYARRGAPRVSIGSDGWAVPAPPTLPAPLPAEPAASPPPAAARPGSPRPRPAPQRQAGQSRDIGQDDVLPAAISLIVPKRPVSRRRTPIARAAPDVMGRLRLRFGRQQLADTCLAAFRRANSDNCHSADLYQGGAASDSPC